MKKIPIVQFDTTFRPSLILKLLMANSLLADVSYNTPEKMVARKCKIPLLVLKNIALVQAFSSVNILKMKNK